MTSAKGVIGPPPKNLAFASYIDSMFVLVGILVCFPRSVLDYYFYMSGIVFGNTRARNPWICGVKVCICVVFSVRKIQTWRLVQIALMTLYSGVHFN